MARQVRFEYPGAFYHVMARGDRRGDIVFGADDSRMWQTTLGEACARTGWRIHAWVLMSNHFHLLLETPEPNLSVGMQWMQTTYTRRFNVRHRQWGHLFGGRFKAIVVSEEGEYFGRLLDYIHLNPVRAGVISPEQGGVAAYRWSSLAAYLRPPRERPGWLACERGLHWHGCRDTAKGREAFLARLEAMFSWEAATKAGLVQIEGQTLESQLRRGWCLGSEAFREQLLARGEPDLTKAEASRAHGYRGPEMEAHGERKAREILERGFEQLELDPGELRSLARNDWRKVLLAELIQSHTTCGLAWIGRRLQTGSTSYTSQLIGRWKRSLSSHPKRRKLRAELLEGMKKEA